MSETTETMIAARPAQSLFPPQPAEPLRVTVANLEIPFWSLVWLLMKLTVAWIPALAILWLIALTLGGTLAAVLAVLGTAIGGT